jgi:hypothetical protein
MPNIVSIEEHASPMTTLPFVASHLAVSIIWNTITVYKAKEELSTQKLQAIGFTL